MAESLDDAIRRKAEERFDKKFCCGFTDEDLNIDRVSEAWTFSDEQKSLYKLKQTKEYKDFKELLVKKYIKEIQKDIVNKAGE